MGRPSEPAFPTRPEREARRSCGSGNSRVRPPSTGSGRAPEVVAAVATLLPALALIAAFVAFAASSPFLSALWGQLCGQAGSVESGALRLPVCARCAGIYLGLAAGAWFGARTRALPAWVLLGLLPIGLEKALVLLGLASEPARPLKALAGFGLGAFCGLVMTAGLALFLDAGRERRFGR